MNAYKKEARLTIGFFIAYVLMGHTAPWAMMIGTDNSVRILGYPAHYFAAIIFGWVGVLVVSVIWNRAADRLEDEISAEQEQGAAEARQASPLSTAFIPAEGDAS